MKKIFVLFVLLIFCQSIIAAPAGAEPNITGAAGILIDAATGKVLWAKNEHEPRGPASITKLVTALVAIENGNLQDSVTISENAIVTAPDESKVWLKAGEVKTLEDLLYAAMLNSGNDAATAIAEHVGGSVEAFAAMMNKKAQEIGAENTHFVNPHGLTAEGHCTTAYDIALFTRAALQNSTLRKIMGTKTREWNGEDWLSRLANLNEMLWRYEGTIGGKSGYTPESGRCLTTAASRDGLELISVVLGSTTERIWDEAAAILDYGFANYRRLKLAGKGDEIVRVEVAPGREVPVAAADDVYFLAHIDDRQVPAGKIKLSNIELPLKKGSLVGTMEFVSGGEVVAAVDLLAGASVRKPVTWVNIYVVVTMTFFSLVALAFILKLANGLRKKIIKYRQKTRRYNGYTRY